MGQIWAQLGGHPADLDSIEWRRSGEILPAIVPVTAAAAGAVAAATLAIARLSGLGVAEAVTVDGAHAALSFRGERLLRVNGGPPPPVWDPIAGDYRCRGVTTANGVPARRAVRRARTRSPRWRTPRRRSRSRGCRPTAGAPRAGGRCRR